MAAESEEPTYLEQLMREAFGTDATPGGEGFFPILVGLMGPPPAADGDPAPPPDRIVLVNPVTQGMVVLQGDPAVVAAILSDRLLGSRRRGGPPPASKASIAAMRGVDLADVKPEEECPVCLVDFSSSEGVGGDGKGEETEASAAAVVKAMPCGHRFHGECIEKWLGMHGSCPVCRFQMPPEETGGPKKHEVEVEEEGEEETEEGETTRRRRRRVSGVWVTVVYSRRRRNGQQSEGDAENEADDEDGPEED